MDIFNDDSVKLDFQDTEIIDSELLVGTQEQLKAQAFKYIRDTCFKDGESLAKKFPLNEVWNLKIKRKSAEDPTATMIENGIDIGSKRCYDTRDARAFDVEGTYENSAASN